MTEVLKLGKVDLDWDKDDVDVEQPEEVKKPITKRKEIKMPKVVEVDDPQAHKELVLTCSRYGTNDRFAAFLKEAGFKFDRLHEKTVKELSLMRDQISAALANRNATGMVKHVFFGALNGLERIPKVLKVDEKFDLSGLANMCQNDPAILDDLAEIECNMGDITSMPPEKRLLLNVTMAAMRVATGNYVMKKAIELHAAQPQPEVKKKERRPDNVEPDTFTE